MFHVIRNVLDDKKLTVVDDALTTAHFIDGRKTAQGMAKNVKNNLQLDNATHPELIKLLREAVVNNPVFRSLTLPVKMTPLLVARYEPGMEYGFHSDNAIISSVRTDVSFTLFLSEPASYQGGELAMRTSMGEVKVKLAAGDLVVYPTGGIHRVAPVTEGARMVAVGWIQSRIRDFQQREIVADLELMRKDYLARVGHDNHADLLLKTSANLQRMWSES
jgi:PKHD-type hydroxylase